MNSEMAVVWYTDLTLWSFLLAPLLLLMGVPLVVKLDSSSCWCCWKGWLRAGSVGLRTTLRCFFRMSVVVGAATWCFLCWCWKQWLDRRISKRTRFKSSPACFEDKSSALTSGNGCSIFRGENISNSNSDKSKAQIGTGTDHNHLQNHSILSTSAQTIEQFSSNGFLKSEYADVCSSFKNVTGNSFENFKGSKVNKATAFDQNGYLSPAGNIHKTFNGKI